MKKHVLIAEDNEQFCKLYQKHLKDHYEVEIVQNGNAVLSALLKREPDLLLLDINMPEKSGIEVLEALLDKPYDFPIVIFSNIGQFMSEEKAKQYGVVGHLEKGSFDIKELPQLIEPYFEA